MNILNELAENARNIVEEKKKNISTDDLKILAQAIELNRPSFKNAIKNNKNISFICELKKASPSKGLINNEFNYLDILKKYELGDAQAISCLTEPSKFLGSLKILNEVSKNTNLPVLRKDFIIDPYQIYEAKLNGASAFLLIVALLSEEELKDFIRIGNELDLDALVEVHNEEELNKALRANAEIIGINNRDLKDFTVNLDTTLNLIKKIPEDKVIITESGILSVEDIKYLNNSKNKIDGVLIGELLMKSPDIVRELQYLKSYED